jgi:23S rRNA (uracil747-C5)-methyltransferase
MADTALVRAVPRPVATAVRLLEPRRIPGTDPEDLRVALCPIDDGGRLGAALGAIENDVDSVIESVLDGPAVGHRLVLPGQDQGRGQQRLGECRQERLNHPVFRNPHADSLLARMKEAPRHLVGSREDEGVRPWSRRPNRAEDVVVDVDELAELSEVAADQGEVVSFVQPPDRQDPVSRRLVAHHRSERVPGIRRIGDEPAGAKRRHGLRDGARLRVDRVNVKIPRHGLTIGLGAALTTPRIRLPNGAEPSGAPTTPCLAPTLGPVRCDYFDAGRCRSCSLMGTRYADQLDAKGARVAELLADHIDSSAWIEPARSPDAHFRNKAKLVVGGRAGRPTFGILDRHGRGVDLRRCGLYEPGLAATFDPLHRFVSDLGLAPYDVPRRRGELKHVIITHSPDGAQLVRFVVRSEASANLLADALPTLLDAVPSAHVVTVNVLPEHRAVLEGDAEVVLTDRELLPMRLADVTLMLGPRSFFQTNTAVAQAMYHQARRWVGGLDPAVVWDLYCGVGGFALHLAAPGRTVVGVETSSEAVGAARVAARAMAPGSGGEEVRFVVADATTTTPHSSPELVVVNPPRRGLGPELAAWLDRCDAAHLMYSSCNADTLARDLGWMPSWRVRTGRVVDMFPQTQHVETMLLLSRR